jgi:hypothetical protein
MEGRVVSKNLPSFRRVEENIVGTGNHAAE